MSENICNDKFYFFYFILLYAITDNIKMDHQEVGYGDMVWIELARIETGGGHV